jgi:hypothetical protein
MLTSAAAERFSPRYRLRMSSPTAPLFSGWNWTASTYIERKINGCQAETWRPFIAVDWLNRRMSQDDFKANLRGDAQTRGHKTHDSDLLNLNLPAAQRQSQDGIPRHLPNRKRVNSGSDHLAWCLHRWSLTGQPLLYPQKFLTLTARCSRLLGLYQVKRHNLSPVLSIQTPKHTTRDGNPY